MLLYVVIHVNSDSLKVSDNFVTDEDVRAIKTYLAIHLLFSRSLVSLMVFLFQQMLSGE